jgi:hypothetical protein
LPSSLAAAAVLAVALLVSPALAKTVAAPQRAAVSDSLSLAKPAAVPAAAAGDSSALAKPAAAAGDSSALATPAATPRAAARRDSASLASPDTTGRGEAEAKRRANRLGEQPRIVMLRSLVVPGWGQLHNHAWFKAVGVAGAEGWLISSILRDRSQLDRLRATANEAAAAHDVPAYIVAVNRYNSRLDGYVGGQWLLGGLLAYALVDAYVDAHFRHFEIEFRSDPALPRDVSPEDGRGGAPPGGSGDRLSLRWHF